MMDIKEVLVKWLIMFLVRIHQVVVLELKLYQINNQLKNYTDQLLENLKNEKYIQLLKSKTDKLNIDKIKFTKWFKQFKK